MNAAVIGLGLLALLCVVLAIILLIAVFSDNGLEAFVLFVLIFWALTVLIVLVPIPREWDRTQISNTIINPTDYTVFKNPSQIGIVFENKTFIPKDYKGVKAVESGEFSIYEQIYQSGCPWSDPKFRVIKIFTNDGTLISEDHQEVK